MDLECGQIKSVVFFYCMYEDTYLVNTKFNWTVKSRLKKTYPNQIKVLILESNTSKKISTKQLKKKKNYCHFWETVYPQELRFPFILSRNITWASRTFNICTVCLQNVLSPINRRHWTYIAQIQILTQEFKTSKHLFKYYRINDSAVAYTNLFHFDCNTTNYISDENSH